MDEAWLVCGGWPPAELARDGWSVKVEDLALTARVRHCLQNFDIETIEDLLKHSREDLMRMPNFGQQSLKVIDAALQPFGVKLRRY